VHYRSECRKLRQALDLAVEFLSPLELVEQERVILSEYDAVRRREGGSFTR
jgi:hypothetical protein